MDNSRAQQIILLILFTFIVSAQYCNWILDTCLILQTALSIKHIKWLLLDFYLLLIPMSGFTLLIERCCFFHTKEKEEKLRVAFRIKLAKRYDKLMRF